MKKYQQILVAASIAALPLSVNAKQLPPIQFETLPTAVFEEGYQEGILNFLPIPTIMDGEPVLTVHIHGNSGTPRGSDADRELAFENDAGGWFATHVDGKRFSLVNLFVDVARFQPLNPNDPKRPFVIDGLRGGSVVATTVIPLGMTGKVTFPSGFSDIDRIEVYPEGMKAQLPGSEIQDFLIAVDDIVVDDLEVSEIDTDKDGLTDEKEAETGTDPNKADTDGDGLNDGDEVNTHQTDPLKPDTDDDGSNDKAEIDAGTDPLLATSKPPEPVDKDTDKDSLTDTKEAELGTDPTKADTDSDGLNDGVEVNTHQSDPLKPDTDGDGFNDKAEIDAGTDPLLATSKPSPITPPPNGNIFPKEGMWWNPQRSGHGVDIEYDGTNIAIAWYTYNDDGTPTWYLAAGPFSGNNWTGKLDTYTWDGTKAAATSVGTATFEFTDQTHAKFSWVIDGVAGNEAFEYLVTSDQPTTLDTTGLWFEAAKPGYGLTISTQGVTEFGILYFYDNQGQPRWALGVKQDSDTYALDQFSGGFCPVCDLTEPVAKPAGTITRTFMDTSKGVLSTDIQLTTPLAGNWKIDKAQIVNLSNP
ncbi:MAG: hypothetical protein V3V18_10415 [Methylococcales bacterium]